MVFKVYEQLIAMLFEHKLVICFYELLITVILETLTGTLINILFDVIGRCSPVSSWNEVKMCQNLLVISGFRYDFLGSQGIMA